MSKNNESMIQLLLQLEKELFQHPDNYIRNEGTIRTLIYRIKQEWERTEERFVKRYRSFHGI